MRVLVGITGGIAAYKAAEIIRELTEQGHDVRCVPTANALRFIGSATLEALTHNPVHSDLYSDVEDVRHIELAQWADLVVVAPATASFLARTSTGIADDLLGNIILATKAPVVVAPAMHTEMWQNDATRANVELLTRRGIRIIEPASGRLTGNDSGVGRLPEPKFIVDEALAEVTPKDLLGKTVLVVAGGTKEPIDPVRFIGNRSSGKQGIALAQEAKARGAIVHLIAANFDFEAPGLIVRHAVTADDVLSSLETTRDAVDIVVMPAAISDYRVENPSPTKIKKSAVGTQLHIDLVQNPDIIASLKDLPAFSGAVVVGFAAETLSGSELEAAAKSKFQSKKLDFVVANDVSNGKAFDADNNSVKIVDANSVTEFQGTKRAIASKIFDLVLNHG